MPSKCDPWMFSIIYLVEWANNNSTSITFEIFINDMRNYESRSSGFVRTNWRRSWWNVNIVYTDSSFFVVRELITVRNIALIVRLFRQTFALINSSSFASSSRIIVRFILLYNEIISWKFELQRFYKVKSEITIVIARIGS